MNTLEACGIWLKLKAIISLTNLQNPIFESYIYTTSISVLVNHLVKNKIRIGVGLDHKASIDSSMNVPTVFRSQTRNKHKRA